MKSMKWNGKKFVDSECSASDTNNSDIESERSKYSDSDSDGTESDSSILSTSTASSKPKKRSRESSHTTSKKVSDFSRIESVLKDFNARITRLKERLDIHTNNIEELHQRMQARQVVSLELKKEPKEKKKRKLNKEVMCERGVTDSEGITWCNGACGQSAQHELGFV